MRGTHIPAFRAERMTGIIPAYAGNTRTSTSAPSDYADHPRVCGEHPGRNHRHHRRRGSSPRMRGTLDPAHPEIDQTGIIPAYAGNTPYRLCGCGCDWDHPRVCGEHHITSIMVHLSWGSSPRMRGTPLLMISRLRLIRDHPRVCGEHPSRIFRELSVSGSSPRMRGTPNGSIQSADYAGIIPAYAGNTLHKILGGELVRDHPRVCGEHAHRYGRNAQRKGSSPRMRGTPSAIDYFRSNRGIIPAYAGNTGVLFEFVALARDHPRVCGEHESWSVAPLCAMGSSPRMRGTR